LVWKQTIWQPWPDPTPEDDEAFASWAPIPWQVSMEFLKRKFKFVNWHADTLHLHICS
jgi:hypothetical protein